MLQAGREPMWEGGARQAHGWHRSRGDGRCDGCCDGRCDPYVAGTLGGGLARVHLQKRRDGHGRLHEGGEDLLEPPAAEAVEQ